MKAWQASWTICFRKWDGIRLTTQIGNDLFLTENRPEWSEIIGSEVVDLSSIIGNNRGQTDAESVTSRRSRASQIEIVRQLRHKSNCQRKNRDMPCFCNKPLADG